MQKTALIVDDDPVSLCLACSLIENRGWRTYTASGVREACSLMPSLSQLTWLIVDDFLSDGHGDQVIAAWSSCAINQPWIIRVSSAEQAAPTQHPWQAFVVKPWNGQTIERLLKAWAEPGPPIFISSTTNGLDHLPLFDHESCSKAFEKYPKLWFRVRAGVGRRLPSLISEIHTCRQREDRRSFQHLAHEIRGMFKLLHSRLLSERAHILENGAETAAWEELDDELFHLAADLPDLQRVLDAFDLNLQASILLRKV